MVKVKICGITNLKDALTAAKLGAAFLGLVFYKKSPRYVTPQKAKRIIARLPEDINCVGVFVNEKEVNVKKIAEYCGFKTLQFHGDESPEYCRKFKNFKIIKAFRIKDKDSLKNIGKFKVSAYLFDTFVDTKFGGTGKKFNWDLLKNISKIKKPVILSGGLNPDNIQQAIKKVSPFAVDVSSGVEVCPGKKSPKLLKELFKKIYKAAKNLPNQN